MSKIDLIKGITSSCEKIVISVVIKYVEKIVEVLEQQQLHSFFVIKGPYCTPSHLQVPLVVYTVILCTAFESSLSL